MRIVIQRVNHASVTVEGETVGAIGKGLMVLVGAQEGDTAEDVTFLAGKFAGMRIFEDEQEKMNLSVKDVGGSVLLVSQFTLLADARKGRRPSFVKAARPDEANRLYRYFNEKIRGKGIKVEEGIFQAEMLVRINNDGPVTILLDSKKLF